MLNAISLNLALMMEMCKYLCEHKFLFSSQKETCIGHRIVIKRTVQKSLFMC